MKKWQTLQMIKINIWLVLATIVALQVEVLVEDSKTCKGGKPKIKIVHFYKECPLPCLDYKKKIDWADFEHHKILSWLYDVKIKDKSL